MKISVKSHQYENDLIQTILANLGKFLPSPQMYVASREVPAGAGIPDIVLGIAQLSNVIQRIQSNHASYYQLKGKEAVIIHYLYQTRWQKADTVARRTGLDTKLVYKKLCYLSELGFCIRSKRDTFTRTPITEQFKELIAIEGKIRNWQKAVEQAFYNLAFASYSYVVMDARYIRPAVKNLESFEKFGIGLASAGADNGVVEIIYQPLFREPKSPIYRFLMMETLGLRIAQDESILSQELQNALPTFSSRSAGFIQ
ncbi:MAG: hypothetical protein K8I82_30545 [Anaerolineae bacterium]|nr:hypothetical protein [Anaerolineae bacterium]